MTHEVFSNHIGSASELLLAVDVKEGFIPHRKTMTYASRLRTFLKLVSVPRARAFDGPDRGLFVTPIDRLRTLHLVRWTLFDDDRRLLLAVTFDHPIGPYIRRIVDEGGPLLDTILCHAKGYEESSTDLGYLGFLKFAQDHQIEADLFTATFPQLTSDDLNFLIGLEDLTHDKAPDDVEIAKHRLTTPAARARETLNDPDEGLKYIRQALRLLRSVHYASRFFPEPLPSATDGLKDHIFYKDFARFLLEQVDISAIPEGEEAGFEAAIQWFGALPHPPARPALPPVPAEKTLADLPAAGVQGGVVTGYRSPVDNGAVNAGAMLFLRFETAAKGGDFLAKIQAEITTQADSAQADPARTGVTKNIALSYRGLKTLNVPDHHRLAFPADFREGAAARAGMIGDFGTNAPELWDPRRHDANGEDVGPMDLETIDAVLTLQTRVPAGDIEAMLGWEASHPLRAHWEGLAADGVTLMAAERMVRREQGGKMVGHFGFVDGISNPVVRANAADANAGGKTPPKVPLSAMILGHDSDASLDTPPLQQDGTYMVVRKMKQNVEAFDKVVGGDPRIGALMVGRKPDGTPLLPAQGENDFDFSDDPDGVACPFASHIRRANPRFRRGTADGEVTHQDAPRIMRRGYSYGPRPSDDPNAERGIMFVCFNASIGEQFEVVQRWLAGGNPTGTYSRRTDALMGPWVGDQERFLRWIERAPNEAGEETETVRRTSLGRTPFVELRWAAYFFVPSLKAIGEIADYASGAHVAVAADEKEKADLLDRGEALIRSLKTESEWKALLEDSDPRTEDRADAVMACIAERHNGVLRLPVQETGGDAGGFVLVSDPNLVMDVFKDTESYSNRGYWRRMKDAIGPVYLGMDPTPQPLSETTGDPEDAVFESSTVGVYNAEAPHVNAHLGFTTHSPAHHRWVFERMYFEVRMAFADNSPPSEPDPNNCATRRRMIDMEELIGATIAGFGLQWLGLPGDWLRDIGLEPARVSEVITEYPHFASATNDGAGAPSVPAPAGTSKAPDDFQEMASYFFGPWPQSDTRERALDAGAELRRRVTNWLDRRGANKLPPQTQIGFLQRTFPTFSNEKLVELALNSAVGLHAPTCASFAGVSYDWLREGTFWRLQQDLADRVRAGEAVYDAALAVLRGPMIASMARYAGPKHLYRICAKPQKSIGGVSVKGGDMVVLALGAAAQARESLTEKETILFGGLYGGAAAPTHACPGRDLAMALMMAAMSSLMLDGEVTRNSSLTVYLERIPPSSPLYIARLLSGPPSP